MLVDDRQAAFIRQQIESVRVRWATECTGKPWGGFLHTLDCLLADRAEWEKEHEAWEALQNGIVWNVWKHDQTGVWSANRDDDTPARNWQADNPVDAVLAAKGASNG